MGVGRSVKKILLFLRGLVGVMVVTILFEKKQGKRFLVFAEK